MPKKMEPFYITVSGGEGVLLVSGTPDVNGNAAMTELLPGAAGEVLTSDGTTLSFQPVSADANNITFDYSAQNYSNMGIDLPSHLEGIDGALGNRWILGDAAPGASTDPGIPGTMYVDTDFAYFCVGPTQWVRIAVVDTF